MTENSNSEQAAGLRWRAEEEVKGHEAEIREPLSLEEARRAVHELRVHQIELEMQNEELRRAQAELEASRARYFDLYDVAPVGYCTLNEKGLILEANLTGGNLLGVERSALIKQPVSRFILPEDQDIYYGHRKQLLETQAPQVCELRMQRADATSFWARIEATARQDVGSGSLISRVAISDITERKRVEAEREHLIGELQGALVKVKLLEGILPICSYCRKIRDKDNRWGTLEDYVGSHSEALFSHSLCPSCAREHYPENLIE